MFTAHVRNVNDALYESLNLILKHGKLIQSRNGDTFELPAPFGLTYGKPNEKVLINPVRDANHFFHLMESMWILAGRQDVKFLSEFNSQMKNYSDDGETFNAPYGHRIKNHFHVDQLKSVVDILSKDPNSRQAVVQIWCPFDLNKQTKDKACNMQIVFRIRDNKLCITVYNRSNDLLWGMIGANAVQFSMIQEYVAAHLKLPVGTYTQISNAAHVYCDTKSEITGLGAKLLYKLTAPQDRPEIHVYETEVKNLVLMSNKGINNIDHDLKLFFKTYDDYGLEEIVNIISWESSYFNNLILPVLETWVTHKKHGASVALETCEGILADDWRLGCEQWLTKRVK